MWLAYGFVAPNGVSYMWVRMAFGVKGACTHYQLQGERAVFDCLDFTVMYVDNNLVHSNDVLTCYVVLKPLRTKGAKEIAYALVEVFVNYGVLKVLQSDNEQTFLLKVVEELRFIAGFQKRNIMKYNPRQNGLVERFVAETKRVLFKWLKGDVSGWEGYVPAVQMSLNDHILSCHNSQPFSLMFGRRLDGFEAYQDGEFSDVMTEEQRAKLLKEVRDWGEDIWSIISEKGKEVGEAHCEPGECQGEEQDLGRGLQGGGFGAEEDSQPAKQDGGTLGGAV